MKKVPIIINSVFVVSIATANLRRLYDRFEDEERYYDMTVGKPQHGTVTIRLTVRRDDTRYFDNLLSSVGAIQP